MTLPPAGTTPPTPAVNGASGLQAAQPNPRPDAGDAVRTTAFDAVQQRPATAADAQARQKPVLDAGTVESIRNLNASMEHCSPHIRKRFQDVVERVEKRGATADDARRLEQYELLALQFSVQDMTFRTEMVTKLVDHAVGAVRTTMQNQG